MIRRKYILFLTVFICILFKVQSQCPGSIFPFPSTYYDCLTGQSTVVFSVNGNQAPYTCTVVNQVNSATVATGTIATNAGGGIYTGTTTGVSVGGFNVYITSANSCTYMTTMQVTIPFSSSNLVFTNTMVSCFGGNDGSSTVFTNGGAFTPPFTYTWTTGSNNQTVGNLSPGIYSVTVKDTKGCAVTNSTQITEPALISSAFVNTLVPCFGGTINTQVSSTGGTPSFTYNVDGNLLSGITASAVAAGTHTIQTKDSKGCIVTETVLVTQVTQPVISFSTISPLCPGSSNGAVSATVTNAPPAFNYTWQPGPSSNSSLNSIPAGNYTLTVKDGSACITKSVVVVSPAVIINATVSTKPENCSAADGSATLSISGGNFPYTFTTTSVGAHSLNVVSNISSGTYTTIIKDGNNCTDTTVFVVGNLSTVSVSISSFTPVVCYNQCNGAIQLSVQNAIPPITYSASGSPTTTSNLIAGMCSGYYIVKVIDAIGCPATTTINFASPPAFSYSASAPSSICFGKNISMQAAVSGGTGPYNFVWNPGNINGQAISLSPAATTVYSLNVYDANNCTLPPYTVTVNVAPPIAININASAMGICPGTTAQITPTVTGGDGNYLYDWLPGNITTSSIFVQNISVPNYTLYVNDGCGSPTAVKIVTINLFPVTKPTFSLSNSTGCEPFCTVFVNTTPKSTNAIWNYGDKPFEQQENPSLYCYEKTGIYNVKLTVTDSNSCRSAFTYTSAVNVLASPDVDFISDPKIITLNNSENVLFENHSAGGLYFEWYIEGNPFSEDRNIRYSFSDTGCASFKLIARNENNCWDSLEKNVCVIEGFNFWMPNCFTPNTDNFNEIFIPKGTGWVEKNYVFEVYNRWGSRIFKTEDPKQGWDGKAGDKTYDCSTIYFWKVNVTDNLDEVHELKGHVMLLR